jgi:FixJ family two-component response regulator
MPIDSAPRVRVLCVDDEPNVLEGLVLHLRRRYDVETATSGAAGLDALRRRPDTAVVVSDMRMPAMDGAAFLRAVRDVAPEATRILLTGHADLDSAIAAVNEGQLFRFLTKPCPSPVLLDSVSAAADQHRLVTAERELLAKTLRGAVDALTDVLAMANPLAFGRATRLRQLVGEMARVLRVGEPWALEVAATFSQIACITLPPATVERVDRGEPLSDEERAMVERLPATTERLLGNIPRLEAVRGILAAATRGVAPSPGTGETAIARAGEILRLAIDFDVLEAQRHPGALAVEILLGRANRYDAAVLEALAEVRGGNAPRDVREIAIAQLRPGMVLIDDVRMSNGLLLVARGYEVTTGFIERVRNFHGMVNEPLRVEVRAGDARRV